MLPLFLQRASGFCLPSSSEHELFDIQEDFKVKSLVPGKAIRPPELSNSVSICPMRTMPLFMALFVMVLLLFPITGTAADDYRPMSAIEVYYHSKNHEQIIRNLSKANDPDSTVEDLLIAGELYYKRRVVDVDLGAGLSFKLNSKTPDKDALRYFERAAKKSQSPGLQLRIGQIYLRTREVIVGSIPTGEEWL
ncbi:MAG: hypothetical protein HOE54_15375, partial [Gammaproteobacteria bacterium]|nr:hypothetical protein [Gammaproteobacteria bacterium]